VRKRGSEESKRVPEFASCIVLRLLRY